MADSYEALVGQQLMPDASPRGMYFAQVALLCHDGAADPCFTYANRRAQQLWKLTWDEFMGMPSRLSAETDAREARAEMLARAERDGFVSDYSGVRIASDGTRFHISDATIWNVTDGEGRFLGQAARLPVVSSLA